GDDHELRHRPVRYPRFYAVKHITPVLLDGGAAYAARVRTRVGLGEPERPDYLPLDSRQKVFLFLGVRSELIHRHARKARVCVYAHGDACIDPAHLLREYTCRNLVEPDAAVFLGERDA